MRVTQVKIGAWRNLRDVDLAVSQDSSLVCLVGENGTGKSAILELLSACAHEFGISQGVETNRGNALDEPHDIVVAVRVSTASLPTTVARAQAYGEDWDGQLEREVFMAPPVPSWPEALPTLVTRQISVVPPWRSCGSVTRPSISFSTPIAPIHPRHSNRSNWLISGSRITLTQHSQRDGPFGHLALFTRSGRNTSSVPRNAAGLA